MIVWQTIAVAFAMFSAVPVPQFGWNEKNMRYALCAFPLVGLLCGALWCVCGVLPLPAPARAAGFCLVPVWVTGGIHLDGYADTCDALASYGDREKKLEILKDPHCGAFAVIRLCSYFAAYLCLAACVQFTPRVGALWTLALVLERALSGLAVAAFPMAKNTGLAHTFASAADRTAVRNVLTVLAVLLCGALLALGGGALAAVAILLFLWYHHVAVQQLGGITGDLAGWFLQKTELWMLAALPGRCITDAQQLAAGCKDNAELEKLADKLSAYDIVLSTEVGGGVVPIDPAERAARENAGRLACLLAARAACVVQMFCGIPTVLKGELPEC